MKNETFKIILINKSFDFSNNLIQFIAGLPSNQIFKVINDQLLRSGLSIGANIAEGYGRNNPKEYKQFLSSDEKQVLKEIAQIMREQNPVWGV